MKTFNDWSCLGFKIKKGSKAHWIDGIPMFDKTQVTKVTYPKEKGSYKTCSPYDAPSYLWESINGNDFDDYIDL